jgi:hypothetical protein
MLAKRNKLEKYLYEKGYRIDDDGIVYNSRGHKINLSLKEGYPSISMRYGSGCYRKVKASRFQAYRLFGDKIYEPDIVVRHLDGDKTNHRKENISIGTMSDNIFDMPKEQRIIKSVSGAMKVNKYSPEFVAKIREEHISGKSYNKIQKEYGISKSSISYIIHNDYVTHKPL